MSASEILDEMLAAMPESYQKTIGFPTYDLLAAVSLRMEGTDDAIDEARQQLDPENLHDSALDRYIYPRSGLERKAATFAHGSLTVTGTGTVDGTAGNLPAHSVTQMPVAVQGIASCDNPEPIGGGYAEESDSEYYARYLVVLRTPATSGNIYHYAQWALEVAGVGHVKVFPRVQGVNTVDVVIADNAGQPASPALVKSVQDFIDPDSEGAGRGQAPIGAQCFVTAATGKAITVSCTVSKSDTVAEDILTSGIKESVAAYLASTVFTQDYISYAQIGAAIMDTPGVIDYAGLKVSGGIVNIAIAERECPVLGEVTITYG